MEIGGDGIGERVRKKSRMMAIEVDCGIGKRNERVTWKRKKEEKITNMMEEGRKKE